MNNWKLYIKQFNDLTTANVYAIMKTRVAVFVVEQACAYLDLDDLDQVATHIWIENKGVLGAYVRVIPPGEMYENHISIGRVVTIAASRNLGLGRRIFQEGLNYCSEKYPDAEVKISAQYYLKRFYFDFGFTQIGTVYLEDGIPHISMQRSISNLS